MVGSLGHNTFRRCPVDTFSVQVNLVVKAGDAKEADSITIDRLNTWFLEPPKHPPYPKGALLSWNILAGTNDY